MSFSARLQQYRKEGGFSQEGLAKQIGVSRQAISKWESGAGFPDLEKTILLCRLFGCTADELLNPEAENGAAGESGALTADAGTIGKNVKSLRTGRGISQEEFAERLNVSRQSVSKWETGSALPKTETLVQMLDILRCPADALLFAASDPGPTAATIPSARRRGRGILAAAIALTVLLTAGLVLLFAAPWKRKGPPPEQIAPVGTDETTPGTADREAPPAVWNGTADTSWFENKYVEYEISTPEQLAGLAKIVNEGEQDFAGRTVRLTADLVFDGKRHWTPIGRDRGHAFRGTFQGNGHSIDGLTVASSGAAGLFGVLSGGTVTDLVVRNGSVKGGENTGTVCGLVISTGVDHPAAIRKCAVTNAVVSGTSSVGGVVGALEASGGAAKIDTCDFTGSVTGTAAVGGVCGAVSANGEKATAEVFNCLENGSVHNAGGINAQGFGGTVGKATAESASGGAVRVSRCVGEGTVCKKTTGAERVGGIAGDLSVTGKGTISVSDCYHVGTVCPDSQNAYFVGGIIGYAQEKGITVSQCYKSGTVTGEQKTGGIIGYFDSYGTAKAIFKCFFIGNLISSQGWVDPSVISGRWQYNTRLASFGGIVGYCHGGESGQVVMDFCVFAGRVSAQYWGAIVGEMTAGSGTFRRAYLNEGCSAGLAGYNSSGIKWDNYDTYPDSVPVSVLFEEADWTGSYWKPTADGAPVLIRS